MGSPAEVVVELAHEFGFDLVGVAPLRPPASAARFQAWLDDGHHADMAWLERNRERISDPRLVLPEGHSVLAVGLSHARAAVELEGGGRVARYAAGRDYHNLMTKTLRKFRRELERRGVLGSSRIIVDAGPLLERSHAAEAGLGFESKAANLLHRDLGPWFFLGELLLEAELEPTTTPAIGSCGTCTACLDACPTDAIVEPGRVDSRRCISYQTIENRSAIPHALRAQFGEWAFGCDICSEVCPWGSKAPVSEAFGDHPAVASSRLLDWLRGPRENFKERFAGSPLRRPGRDGLARNAAIALGNAPTDAGREGLLEALDGDSSGLVREAAGWALMHAHARDARVAERVESALSRESDAAAAGGLRRSRAAASGDAPE